MKNKVVGYIIIIIALVLGIINFTYNRILLSIAQSSCSITGPSCPHLLASNQQLLVNGIILGFIILIGLYLILFSKEEKIITKIKKIREQIQPKKLTKENYQDIINKLDKDERNVLEKILEHSGTIFQSDLADHLALNKVKVTRILDRLEGKGLIERKRRGMTNVVILKHQ